MSELKKAAELLSIIKHRRPLIHHITNVVTVNDCANITLAIGASPIMATAQEEVEEIVSLSKALVLNIGTLTPMTLLAMLKAGSRANELNIPVVFDPVGVGVSRFRQEACEKIFTTVKVSVLKGNMAEIKYLAGAKVKSRGVDSMAPSENSDRIVKGLARKLGCIVAATGKRDVISDGKRGFFIENGRETLADITGSGCMVSSLVASYCGVTDDYLAAALGGIISLGIAGEMASDNIGIGSFRINLFDALYNLTAKTIREAGVISEF